MAAPKYGSEQYVKYFFTGDAVDSRPASWEVALHSGDPGTGDGNEVSDGAYSRQPATFSASDSGSFWQASNDADVDFPAAGVGADYTVTHFSIRDGDGNALLVAPLQVPIPIVAGGIVSFPAGFLIARGV